MGDPKDTRAEVAERRFRAMMADADLPEPDEVQHSPSQVRFLWHGAKVAVVVDLEDD